MRRPLVVAFDIIQTVISIEPLRQHLIDGGLSLSDLAASLLELGAGDAQR